MIKLQHVLTPFVFILALVGCDKGGETTPPDEGMAADAADATDSMDEPADAME